MTDPTPDDREAARRKLIGRLIILGFGVLLLAYIVVMWLPRRS